MEQPNLRINRVSRPGLKVALFRELFRGRDDVYARRFESRRTGNRATRSLTPMSG